MIFGVNTIPGMPQKGYAGQLIRCAIEQAKKEGRKGLVLTWATNCSIIMGRLWLCQRGRFEIGTRKCRWYQMRLTL